MWGSASLIRHNILLTPIVEAIMVQKRCDNDACDRNKEPVNVRSEVTGCLCGGNLSIVKPERVKKPKPPGRDGHLIHPVEQHINNSHTKHH